MVKKSTFEKALDFARIEYLVDIKKRIDFIKTKEIDVLALNLTEKNGLGYLELDYLLEKKLITKKEYEIIKKALLEYCEMKQIDLDSELKFFRITTIICSIGCSIPKIEKKRTEEIVKALENQLLEIYYPNGLIV